jgi:hypothetical protein
MTIVPLVWAIYWPIYNACKRFYRERGMGVLQTSVFASASTSFTMLLLINPLLVVRVRLQTQHMSNVDKYHNLFQAGRLIMKEEGIMSLYQGYLISLFGGINIVV